MTHLIYQRNHRIIGIILIISIFCLITPVLADTTPPAPIHIYAQISYCDEIGIWWENPTDPDFDGVLIWINNTYLGTTNSTVQFYNTGVLPPGINVFATHTIDTSSNINTTWVNASIETFECPYCPSCGNASGTSCPLLLGSSPVLHKSSINPSALSSNTGGEKSDDTWMIFAIILAIIAILGFVYFYQKQN